MATTWVARSEWGARAPRSKTGLSDRALRGMAVHYTAAEWDRAPDHASCDDRVRAIQNLHMNSNGWADIAYSWLACQHGYAFEGRGWDVRTAANGTNASNDQYHAVCFLGADKADRDDVGPAGRLAIYDVITESRRRFPAGWEVRPHSDFRATACPGNELRQWIGADMPIDTATGERPPDMPSDLIVVHSKPVAVEGSAAGGYWIATADGGVFTFGGAAFHGSLGGHALNAPVVDMVGTADGGGYWLVGADGGVFGFGNAPFHGSLGGVQLNEPIVDFSRTPDDGGYWYLAGDGGLFASGNAPFGGRIEYRPA